MYFISKFCGVCLKNDANLLPVPKSSEISSKLRQCLRDVDWSFVEKFYICFSCNKKLDDAFEFRQMCIKSADALKWYLVSLQEEAGIERKDLIVRLTKNEIPTHLLNDYKLKNTVSPNIVLPSPNGAVIPGTNIILNPFSFYNIPTNAVVPFSFHPDSQITPQPTIGFHSSAVYDSSTNLIMKAPNFINPLQQLLIIKPAPPYEPQLDSTKDIGHLLNNMESEEMSISVDPAIFDTMTDGSYSNLDTVESEHEANPELDPFPHTYIKEKTKGSFYNHANGDATVVKANKLKQSKKPNESHHKKHSEKNTNSTVCPMCNRRFCTKQYLQIHLSRCKQLKQKHRKSASPKKRGRPKKIVNNIKQEEHKNIADANIVQTLPSDDLKTSKVNSELKTEEEIYKSNGASIVEASNSMETDAGSLITFPQIPLLPPDVENGKFRCGYCTRTYNFVEHLMQHLASRHKDIKHFRCQFCDIKFISGTLLEEHLPEHYNYFKCCGCNKTSSDTSEMVAHLAEHRDTEAVKCVSCNADFKTRESIEKHSELHLKNLVFECLACDEKHKRIEDLHDHMAQHFDFVSCSFCKREFWSEFLLREHIEVCG